MHYDPQFIRGHRTPPYRHVAWVYDALASLYSLGAIDRAKAYHARWIGRGDRVLYAGAGRGREVVLACDAGADVVCVEPCAAMVNRLRYRTAGSDRPVAIDPRPIQSVPADAGYDLVAAHFFLNLFGAEEMNRVLDHLCKFIKQGGRLVIADFRPPSIDDGVASRAMRLAYYRPLNVVGWLLRICALHPIYDYAAALERRGLTIEDTHPVRVLPGLGDWYQVTVARRV